MQMCKNNHIIASYHNSKAFLALQNSDRPNSRDDFVKNAAACGHAFKSQEGYIITQALLVDDVLAHVYG